MRIKKFEFFITESKYLFPEQVDFNNWMEKRYDKTNKEAFSTSELDFFNQLKSNNKKAWESFQIFDSDINCSLYQINSDELQEIEVYKMKDEWFLIYDNKMRDKFDFDMSTCYIADQFDEVKGFFAKNTTLQF